VPQKVQACSTITSFKRHLKTWLAVSSGVSVYLILATFKEWKTLYISRATVAGRRTSGVLEVQMMMMMIKGRHNCSLIRYNINAMQLDYALSRGGGR